MNKPNILVTGSNGFLGSHLVSLLKEEGYHVFCYDKENSLSELKEYIKESSFLFHLAGINRPTRVEEFYEGNTSFTKTIISLAEKMNPNIVIVYASSIQAELDNDYGKSKKQAEEALKESKLDTRIYRLSNVFGPGCRPNYNSVVATFCDNLSKGIPLYVRDPNYEVPFQYVEDVTNAFLNEISKEKKGKLQGFLSVYPIYKCSLGHLQELLVSFKDAIESKDHLPLISHGFELKLFKTLCFYLREKDRKYNKARDSRGYFEEIYKDARFGQISINMAYPGITKGGHYHTRKDEIFLTVIGNCLIKQVNVDSNDTIIDEVSGDDPRRINIIPYYSHTIETRGDIPSYTLMWISEIYDETDPDTIRK